MTSGKPPVVIEAVLKGSRGRYHFPFSGIGRVVVRDEIGWTWTPEA